jgi:hypothetical protein
LSKKDNSDRITKMGESVKESVIDILCGSVKPPLFVLHKLNLTDCGDGRKINRIPI